MIPKFRAWVKDMGEMVEVHMIQLEPHSTSPESYILDQHNDVHLLDEIELIQFIGLYDTNGKEIYRGDIVRCTVPGDAILYVESEIIYDPEIAGYRMKSYYNNWSMRTYEVIGNIFENPELIGG